MRCLLFVPPRRLTTDVDHCVVFVRTGEMHARSWVDVDAQSVTSGLIPVFRVREAYLRTSAVGRLLRTAYEPQGKLRCVMVPDAPGERPTATIGPTPCAMHEARAFVADVVAPHAVVIVLDDVPCLSPTSNDTGHRVGDHVVSQYAVNVRLHCRRLLEAVGNVRTGAQGGGRTYLLCELFAGGGIGCDSLAVSRPLPPTSAQQLTMLTELNELCLDLGMVLFFAWSAEDAACFVATVGTTRRGSGTIARGSTWGRIARQATSIAGAAGGTARTAAGTPVLATAAPPSQILSSAMQDMRSVSRLDVIRMLGLAGGQPGDVFSLSMAQLAALPGFGSKKSATVHSIFNAALPRITPGQRLHMQVTNSTQQTVGSDTAASTPPLLPDGSQVPSLVALTNERHHHPQRVLPESREKRGRTESLFEAELLDRRVDRVRGSASPSHTKTMSDAMRLALSKHRECDDEQEPS